LKVWFDDVRDPKDYQSSEWIWLKNWSEWENFILNYDLSSIECFSFDNDIGEQKEGYDAFLQVEEALYAGLYKGLKRIYVHSSNPSAVHKFMLAARTFKSQFGIDVIRNPL